MEGFQSPLPSSRSCRRSSWIPGIAGDFQSGIAQAFEQLLDEFGVEPFLQFGAADHGKVGTYLHQLLGSFARRVLITELRIPRA